MKNNNELCDENKNKMKSYSNHIKNLSFSQDIKTRSSEPFLSYKRIIRKSRSDQNQNTSTGFSILACVFFGISVLLLGMSIFWKQSSESGLLTAASILSSVFCFTICFSNQNKK